jgi:zinc protease
LTPNHCSPVAIACAALLACASQPPLAPPPPLPRPVSSLQASVPAPSPPATTPDAPFRERPPLAGPAVAWRPPKVDAWTLPNGLRVLFVERHDLPVVSVRFLSTIGAGDVPGAKPGTIPFMAAMLEQGAGKRTALGISDDYEAMGASHGTWADWDTCGARAKVLASHLSQALDLLADILLRPTFQDAEVDRLRKRWLASIEQEKSSPAKMEQNAVGVALFGRAHPYGHSQREVAGVLEKITRAEIEAAWRRIFVPHSTAIVVAGDVSTDELRPMLESRWGAWTGGTSTRAPVPSAPAAPKGGRPVVLVDVPRAAQSQVYVVGEAAPVATPDRIPLEVMNLILGGLFSSRINLDLREVHAYTYGARSFFAMHHGAGPFMAGGAIFVEHTGDAVRELLAQVARIRAEPVSTEELADAKEHAKLALPARFESVDQVTQAVQEIAAYGWPLDEYVTLSARIDAVTAADVQRVAKRWLHPDAPLIVVTGDRTKIETDLASFGSIEMRDALGELVK